MSDQYKILDYSYSVIIEGDDNPYGYKDITAEIIYEAENLPTKKYVYVNIEMNNCLVRTSEGHLIFINKSNLRKIVKPTFVVCGNGATTVTIYPQKSLSIFGLSIDKTDVENIIKAWNNIS